MRIAHVVATFPPYLAGTGNVCFHNAVALAKRGHAVDVFTGARPLPKGWCDPDKIRVYRLVSAFRYGNAPFTPALLGRLRGYDLVHLHWPYIFGAELTWAASRLFHFPYVLTYHIDLIGKGLRSPLFAAYQAFWLRRLLQSARAVFAVAADHFLSTRAAPLAARFGTPVHEVSNGVDVTMFRPGNQRTARIRLGLPLNEPVLLFVAALDQAHYYKGLELVLDALRLLNGAARGVVVGDGDLKSFYMAEAARKGVRAQVQFVGAIGHDLLPDYYRAADVTVLPSTNTESFGLVLVESMACGTPVIASNLPGPRSVVSPGEDGLLVKKGDVADLAQKIHELFANPARREQMGMQGRAKVERRYSWDVVAARLEPIYHQVLSEDQPSKTSAQLE